MDNLEFERLLKTTRLKLDEKEKIAIQKDIEEVIGYFEKISEIDTEGEEKAYHPIKVDPRFREDSVSRFADVDMLKRQSKLQDGYIIGPKL
jgi:aspartyl-tRNA(Asn)/glutamyl-tRNA(Gln) amidotransferase subunit C